MCVAHCCEPVLFHDKDYICQALSAHVGVRKRIILPRIALSFPLTRGRRLFPPFLQSKLRGSFSGEGGSAQNLSLYPLGGHPSIRRRMDQLQIISLFWGIALECQRISVTH